MVARNRNKNKNKRKIPSVVPATLGTVVGGGGAAAFATNYLTRQNQYDNHPYSENLYKHMMEKGTDSNYKGAGDAVYTKDEYLNRMRDYYYNEDADGKLTVFDEGKEVTKEYADSMISQAENNPNLFINKTETFKDAYNPEKKSALEAALNTANGTIEGTDNNISSTDLDGFLASDEVNGKVLTSEEFGQKLTNYLGKLKKADGTTNKYTSENITTVVGEIEKANAFDADREVTTQLLNTEYADKAALYETMSNKATAAAGWWQNIKDGMKTQAGRLAENSLLLKETAKVTGKSVEELAEGLTWGGTILGTGLAVGLGTLAAKKVIEGCSNLFSGGKKQQAKEEERAVTGKKLSQAKAANAMRVQMAEDFENTASHGHFNNR